MVFRTTSAIAALLIGLGGAGGQALAQYNPSAQASPSQGYPTRQPFPAVANGDEDAPRINAPVVQGPSLPPIGVGPQWNGSPAGTRYGRGTPAYPADTAPPAAGGQPYRSVQPPDGYEYYGVPGAIPPGPAGSAKQDAILQEAMRSPLSISPGQTGPGPDDSDVGGSMQGDPRNMAGSPPDVRPETRSGQPPQNYEPAGEVANLSRRSFLFGLTVVGIGSAIAMSVGVNAADGCGRCLEATSVAELPTVPDDAATAAVIRHGRRRPWRQLGRIGRERRAIVATTTHALLAGKVPAQSAQCCCSIGRRRIISGSAEVLAMSAMCLDERAPAQETRLRSSH
jgi:hypothetical protein